VKQVEWRTGTDDQDTVRLMKLAMKAKEYRVSLGIEHKFGRTTDWQLCKELLRFLRSIDESGEALRQAISEIDKDDTITVAAVESEGTIDTISAIDSTPRATRPTDSSIASTDSRAAFPMTNTPTAAEIGPPPTESPRRSHQSHFRHPSAPSPSTKASSQLSVSTPGTINSPFDLTSPRAFMTPPSPRTVVVPEGLVVPDVPAIPEEEEEGLR